jgi:hypothetical protein
MSESSSGTLGSEIPDEVNEEALDQAWVDSEASTEGIHGDVDAEIKRLLSQDRSRIAKTIVWLFSITCIGTLIFIAAATFWGAAEWATGAELMITILSSIILPVVTLVIGYYFGAETKQ